MCDDTHILNDGSGNNSEQIKSIAIFKSIENIDSLGNILFSVSYEEPNIVLEEPNSDLESSSSSDSVSTLAVTLPSPNPVPNSANITFNFIVDPSLAPTAGSSNTNIVSATINVADLISTKAVSTNFANVNDILTFTVTIVNDGNASANNVLFVDTIPNSTTFIANSLTINGVPNAGSPNPPGVI